LRGGKSLEDDGMVKAPLDILGLNGDIEKVPEGPKEFREVIGMIQVL
jgi:hypothetical protein